MSLARRQYNARQGAVSPAVVDNVPFDPACDWDAEAIEKALAQARMIEEFDPEAAKQLRAQAMAAKAKLDGKQGSTGVVLEPYDPMRLMARMLRHYKGAITDADLARMDYRRFFGYARELDLMLEEEAEAAKGTGNHGKTSDAVKIVNEFPHPQPYEGETIKLI